MQQQHFWLTYSQSKVFLLHLILLTTFPGPEVNMFQERKCLFLTHNTLKVWQFMLHVRSMCIYLPSTVASRAIRMYMPFSAWRKYAALGSVSTSALREKHKGNTTEREVWTQGWCKWFVGTLKSVFLAAVSKVKKENLSFLVHSSANRKARWLK